MIFEQIAPQPAQTRPIEKETSMPDLISVHHEAKPQIFSSKARMIVIALFAALFTAAFASNGNHTIKAAQSGSETQNRFVYINKTLLNDATVYALERKYRVRIPDGKYWYDKICGAWGVEGGPTAGFILPGLKLGGLLRADASNGRTRVVVNGRELHAIDVLGLQRLGPVYPGRYWVDAQGYAGYEGQPPFCNLIQLANQAGLLSGGGRKRILSGMYDSGIGRVLGNGDFYISGNSSITH